MENQDEGGSRKLDIALDSSIDLVALNNKVVAMRGTVKKSIIFTIHKLKKRIKKLRGKKGTEEQMDQNKRKIGKLQEELQTIRVLNPDQISKYALGCTMTVSDVCKQADVAIETRALTRLAWDSSLQASVKRFRDEHDDWKSLAAFLLYKQSGRRIKKKKKKPDSVHKMITNVKAGELMVKTYLQEKLDKNISVSSTLHPVSVKKDQTNKKDKVTGQTDLAVRVGKEGSKSMIGEELMLVNISASNQSDEEKIIIQWDEEGEDIFDEESNKIAENDEEEDNVDTESSHSDEESCKPIMQKTNIVPLNINSGEMVVKKLNLDEMSDEDSQTADLFTRSKTTVSATVKGKKRKACDSFFVSSDVEEGNEDSDSNVDDRADCDMLDEEDSNYESEDDVGNKLSSGKKAFHSTFVNSLSDSKRSAGHHGKGRQAEKAKGQNIKGKGNNSNRLVRGSIRGQNGSGILEKVKGKGSFRKGDRFDSGRGNLKAKKFNKTTSWGSNRPGRDLKRTKNFTAAHPQQKTEGGSSKQPEEKLHPSWQASKKRKEQGQIQVFQGKKIKFDD